MSLTDILKDDAMHAYYFSKGVFNGAIKGTYSPFIISTSIKNTKDYYSRDLLRGEKIGHSIGHLATYIFLNIPMIVYEAFYGDGHYYIAALIATNTFDYAISVKRRSKEKD